MTVGHASAEATAILNLLRNTNATGYDPFVKLHTGDPGSAGTSNAATETTRKALTFAAPSAGSSAATQVSWTSYPASETLTHFSIWDAETSGNFKRSGALTSSIAPVNGDTVNLTITATQGPLAA